MNVSIRTSNSQKVSSLLILFSSQISVLTTIHRCSIIFALKRSSNRLSLINWRTKIVLWQSLATCVPHSLSQTRAFMQIHGRQFYVHIDVQAPMPASVQSGKPPVQQRLIRRSLSQYISTFHLLERCSWMADTCIITP